MTLAPVHRGFPALPNPRRRLRRAPTLFVPADRLGLLATAQCARADACQLDIVQHIPTGRRARTGMSSLRQASHIVCPLPALATAVAGGSTTFSLLCHIELLRSVHFNGAFFVVSCRHEALSPRH